MNTSTSHSCPSSNAPSGAGEPASQSKPVPANKRVRAHAAATSRPRPTMKRPGRAAPEKHEPCPACPPRRARLPEQAPSSSLSARQAEPRPSGACARPRRAARAARRKSPRAKPKLRITFEEEGKGSATALDGTAAKAKRGRPKKRVRLADALFAKGVDVHELAEGYAVAFRKLKAKEASSPKGSVAKTFIDTLEKVRNIVEPARPASDRAPDAPAVVKLIHRVPRPKRGRA